jgi:AcrR family transcriptional regulator
MEYSEKQMQILDVAERLFATHGFDGASVRDIAKEAEVNVAMISYYFGSKEKLLESIFQKRAEFIKMQIESLLSNETLTPMEKMYKLVDAYVEKVMLQQNFHKLMLCLQITEQDGLISKAIYETKRKNHEMIKQLIAEGQKKGDFKKNIDIPMMMVTMIGTANQLVASQRFYREMYNMQSLTEEEFKKHLKKKLTTHIKALFKTILTNEA